MRRRQQAKSSEDNRLKQGGKAIMTQLKIGDLLLMIEGLKASYELSEKELKEVPIWLSDADCKGKIEEVQGVHQAYFYEAIAGDSERVKVYQKMIEKTLPKGSKKREEKVLGVLLS